MNVKGRYSKWIVAIVILLNVGFSFGILWAMKNGAEEPTKLIDRWFDWTTVELAALTGIKVTNIFKELIETLKNKTNGGGEG